MKNFKIKNINTGEIYCIPAINEDIAINKIIILDIIDIKGLEAFLKMSKEAINKLQNDWCLDFEVLN